MCKQCNQIRRLVDWHLTECQAFQAAPEAAKRGDSSVLRMLLRYSAISQGDWADASMGKEPLGLLETLEAHSTSIPENALLGLSKLTRLPTSLIAKLIFQ